MPVQRFAARWSALTWIVTLLVIGVAIVAVGGVLSQAEKVSPDERASRAVLIAAAMVVPAALLISVVFAPLGYTVDDVGIVVNRIGPKVCVLHSEIREIRRMAPGDLGFSLRVGGSGGFFGFFGRFWSRRVGHHRMYGTNGRDLVYIERVDGVKIILSPYPAGAFVATVEAARGGVRG
jgi:hypothetical protein